MNIQDEIQKIHHKYGVSEMANYRIEQFIESLIEEKLDTTALGGQKCTCGNNTFTHRHSNWIECTKCNKIITLT